MMQPTIEDIISLPSQIYWAKMELAQCKKLGPEEGITPDRYAIMIAVKTAIIATLERVAQEACVL
jgi:hypothetical protein